MYALLLFVCVYLCSILYIADGRWLCREEEGKREERGEGLTAKSVTTATIPIFYLFIYI